MEWKLLLRELDKLNLPKDKYAITSSGCLAVRGIREANDVDIIVTDDLWCKLIKSYKTIKSQYDGEKITLSNNVEALGGFKNPPTTDELITKADKIDGRRYVDLNWIIFFKVKWEREKDLRDINLIDKYLKKNSK